MERKNEAQKLCGRRRCRNDYRTFPQSYDLHWYKGSKNVIGPPKKPAKSGSFWCDKNGRGRCWEQVSDEGRSELRLINRDGCTVAQLVQLTSGWRMLQPRLIPQPADEPDLNKAKAQALHAALAALPLDAGTAARIRRENTDRQPYLSRSDAGERYARGESISTSQWRPSPNVNPDDVTEIPKFLLRARGSRPHARIKDALRVVVARALAQRTQVPPARRRDRCDPRNGSRRARPARS
jgi:hypothetical protein